MRTFLFILLVTAPLFSYAQEFSVGARTGIGRNFYLRTRDMELAPNTTWDKQAYLRYQSRKRFALEVGAEHYGFQDNGSNTNAYSHFDNSRSIWTTKTSNTALYLSLQYDLTCRKAQNSCPLLKNMRSYIGIILAPVFITWNTENEMTNLVNGNKYFSTYTGNTINIMGGLSHTLVYKFSNHLSFSSVFSYKLHLSAAFSQLTPIVPSPFENHINYQAGVGYTF